MKLRWNKMLPQTLAILLIASSPLNVLSTTAYASSLDKAEQELVSTSNTTPLIVNSDVFDDVNAPPDSNYEPGYEPDKKNDSDDVQEPVVSNPPAETPVETNPNPPSSPTEEVINPPVEVTPPVTPVDPSVKPIEEVIPEIEPLPEVPDTMDGRFALAKKTMAGMDTYEKQRVLVEDAVKAFQKEQTIEKLQLVMDYTVLLPYSEKDMYKGDKMDYTILISSLVEFVKKSKDKDELFFHFATTSIDQTLITLRHNDLDIAEYAYSILPEGKKKQDINKKLQIAKNKVFAKHSNPDSGYINWDDPNIDYGKPPVESDKNNWDPGYTPPKGGYLDPDKNYPKDNFTEGFDILKYFSENGSCYKVTLQYGSNGNLIKRTQVLANESEKAFCVTEVPSGNVNDFYEGWDKVILDNVTGSPDSFGVGVDGSNGSLDPNDPNAVNGVKLDTIQYTFEKNDDSPYYQDTGISVSEDNTITYQQARDALYQITVSAKSKFVEDKDRALGLLDGRIILVEDPNKPMPMKDFIALFDDTSIGVKVQTTRSGDTYALIDLVEVKDVTSVTINGKKITLEDTPIVDDGIVLLPVETLTKALNGKSSETVDSTTLEYKGNRITFVDNQSTATLNEEELVLSVPTRQNQKGVRMVEIHALLDFFQAEIEVLSDTDEVVITTK